MKAKRETKTIQVNDAALHYVHAGNGEPVVFVHGSLSDFRTWRLQMKALSKRYHAVSYSRRFHYPNMPAEDVSDYSVDRHAGDLASFIRQLGLGSVHLIALSRAGLMQNAPAMKMETGARNFQPRFTEQDGRKIKIPCLLLTGSRIGLSGKA